MRYVNWSRKKLAVRQLKGDPSTTAIGRFSKRGVLESCVKLRQKKKLKKGWAGVGATWSGGEDVGGAVHL